MLALMALAMFLGFLTSRTARGATRPPAIDANVPYPFDPNLCAGEVMDWAICEPNVTTIYGVRFFTLSGRPAEGLDVTLGGGEIINVHIKYEGRVKDPNGPGWFHEWTIGYTPASVGVHHLNLKAWYGPRSHSRAWWLPPGPLESDVRTILLNVVAGDAPFLLPGTTPTPISHLNRASRFLQHAKANKWPISRYPRVWSRSRL
jgi:hypothetical protein